MYLICESYSVCELCTLVQEKLNEGYICQGGICSTSESECYSAKFYQAMIKNP